jgi:hypothetical protein
MMRGRVLYVAEKIIILAKGNFLYLSEDGGATFSKWKTLPVKSGAAFKMQLPILARLLRKGVHHIAMGEDSGVILANRDTFLLSRDKIDYCGPLHGSRPLTLCETTDGSVYYGEYRSNPHREPVGIWKLDSQACAWMCVWKFERIRHIHGIFEDPNTSSLWITTGDKDDEVGIWRTDDSFSTVSKVAGGSQQLRAVQLLFTKEYVYFGSDTPNEQNHIYRMDRRGNNIECLTQVDSSVFFGCTVGDSLFFSTAAEPSSVNTTQYAAVWRSDNGSDWWRWMRFPKDCLPMKYFQYGQVLFPSGPGDGRHLWLTPFATRGHNKSIKIDVKAQE